MSKLVARLPKSLAGWSNVGFYIGLSLTVVLLPADRVGPFTVLVPWCYRLSLLLILQYAIITLCLRDHWREFSKQRLLVGGVAFGAFLLGAAVSIPSSYARVASSAAFILLTVAVLRAWILQGYTSRRHRDWFERNLYVVTWVVLGYAVWQFVGDLAGWPLRVTGILPRYSSSLGTFVLPRVHATALEPLYLAHFLMLPFWLLVVKISRRQARWHHYCLAILTALTIIATNSRGGVLALGITVIIFGLIKLYHRLRQSIDRWLIIVLALCILAVTGLVGMLAAQRIASNPARQTVGIQRSYVSFFTHYTDINDRSANTRYELWPQAVASVHHNEPIGIGFYASRYYLAKAPTTADANQLQPLNNDYLSYAMETGLLGVILALPLLALIAWALLVAARANFRSAGSGYALALIAMAIQANSFQSILLLRTWVAIGMLLAATQFPHLAAKTRV